MGDPRFLDILDEIKALHEKKSFDYGTDRDALANMRASTAWGVPAWVGTMIRANDKIIRLQSLINNGELANESARDSLIDLASYAIIALVLMEEDEEDPFCLDDLSDDACCRENEGFPNEKCPDCEYLGYCCGNDYQHKELEL